MTKSIYGIEVGQVYEIVKCTCIWSYVAIEPGTRLVISHVEPAYDNASCWIDYCYLDGAQESSWRSHILNCMVKL